MEGGEGGGAQQQYVIARPHTADGVFINRSRNNSRTLLLESRRGRGEGVAATTIDNTTAIRRPIAAVAVADAADAAAVDGGGGVARVGTSGPATRQRQQQQQQCRSRPMTTSCDSSTTRQGGLSPQQRQQQQQRGQHFELWQKRGRGGGGGGGGGGGNTFGEDGPARSTLTSSSSGRRGRSGRGPGVCQFKEAGMPATASTTVCDVPKGENKARKQGTDQDARRQSDGLLGSRYVCARRFAPRAAYAARYARSGRKKVHEIMRSEQMSTINLVFQGS